MKRRAYSKEFKQLMMEAYFGGKDPKDLMDTYFIPKDTFQRWIKHYETAGPFTSIDHLSQAEKKQLTSTEELEGLRRENEILLAINAMLKKMEKDGKK